MSFKFKDQDLTNQYFIQYQIQTNYSINFHITMHKNLQAQIKQSASQNMQTSAFEQTIHFSLPHAIIWQVRLLLNQVNTKKMLTSTSIELDNLGKKFGKDFDKLLLRELIDQIDVKDQVKVQKEKNEPLFKVQLLNQELNRCIQKPEFLQIFQEIVTHNFGDKPSECLAELTKRLRLNQTTQLMIALSLFESSNEKMSSEAINILKLKLVDYYNMGRPEPLPEYAVHRLMYELSINPELVRVRILIFCQNQDENMREIAQYIRDSNPLKPGSQVGLRVALQSDITQANANPDDPSISLFREGTGLDTLDKSYKILEPWQILIDLGHFCTYNYNYLLKILEEFKEITEKTMAKTMLYLAINHTGTDDLHSRIVYNTLDSCKKGDATAFSKDLSAKKTQMTWGIDNLARAFRELFSNLNWARVFESLVEIEDDITLDSKAFSFFLQIFNKSKPQNLGFQLNVLLNEEWFNPSLQLNFIQNSIQTFIEKKDKSMGFQKTDRRQEIVEDITGVKEKVPAEALQVWLSVDLVERLIIISDSSNFTKVRALFDFPIKQMPEYLLLVISQCKPDRGNLMLDEILSLLLPQFLGNHINSIPVLLHLWKNNQALMIRGICELCRHDQRIMNLSRVLDITQEVKESLIPIVNCEDYYFAVNLGILAGKRDFLHYDAWLKGRIDEVGSPFIKALIKYLKEHIILPIQEFTKKSINQSTGQMDATQEVIQNQKEQILERSHLSKEKLCITIEHLSNLQNQRNPRITEETHEQIRDLMTRINEFFPSQITANQSSEEIDNAANDYFQRVFSAEPTQVDQKIEELIETMQRFKESSVKKEQEIYACMLHSLFDEYRFLHRYPSPYLEKIAKLFGAIIKHKLIDGTLQEIALKFAYEAFRREGKRQKFGVITIRQFFDMLPQFQTFFNDIYEIRKTVELTDPKMVTDIEELWEKTMKKKKEEAKDEGKRQDEKKDRQEEKTKHSHEKKGTGDQMTQVQQMPKINESEFLNNFQQNQKVQPQQKGNQPVKVQEVQSDQSKQRTSTPLQAQVFIPTYKARPPEQQTQIPKEQSQLNVSSAIFKKGGASQQNVQQVQTPQVVQQQMQQVPFVTSVPQFRPSMARSPAPHLTLSPQTIQMQAAIDGKLQKAIQENSKIRVEDLIEDNSLPIPSPEQQEQIRFICNNIGKTNFTSKLEELKTIIGLNPQLNLSQLIQYILTKRMSQQSTNLHHFYIDMIKQLNQKDAISQTLAQAADIFKKCMLIDEEMLAKATGKSGAQRPQNQGSLIKQYLITLGQFLGGLTVASNRPILAREIDLKKLLVDGFFSDKFKYVVAFVCRILKECQKSAIFRPQNPWIKANLEVLREIHDWAFANNQEGNQDEILFEINSLCRSLGLNTITEIKDSGFLKAIFTKSFINPLQQIEVGHLSKKDQLVPPPPSFSYYKDQPDQDQQQTKPGPVMLTRPQSLSPIPIQPGMQIFPLRQTTGQQMNELAQKQKIYDRVVVSRDFIAHFPWLNLEAEQKLRDVVAKAVDSSIVEILPPVVDRSVTIALITTKELVLKDFAFDGDFNKVMRAADLIVQNLAGSLALVTCREPLKMSLTTNLKRSIQGLIQEYYTDNDESYSDNVVSEIAQIAAKENLELGCKLIKKSVVDKALSRVREDSQIKQAVEKRRISKSQNVPLFVDENIASLLAELPTQLKPSANGLTDAQFQVYEDFERLNQGIRPIIELQDSVQTQQYQTTDNITNDQRLQKAESSISDIESILKQLERQQCLDDVVKYQITQKLQQIQVEKDQDEIEKLWAYMQKWVLIVCERFVTKNDIEQIQGLVDVMSFIVQKFKNDELSKRITKFFLGLNDTLPRDLDLSILLLKSGVLSVQEWDMQISHNLREYLQFQQEDAFVTFVNNILVELIFRQGLFSKNLFPNLISVIEKLSEQSAWAKFFSPLLEEMKQKFTCNNETLKNYFLEWAAMSFEENNPRQEQEVNQFFSNLQQLGLYKDAEIMYNFCKVMVEVSIQRALFAENGERRPGDRLDYRYIESFLKLMVVLLKTSDINKHEFMSKLFEAIQEVLDADHSNTRTEFNQKPYYRLLINILTAVNNSQFFNPKTHLLILFSLADLFSKLNPNKYPAFSFAWLELISHKEFMPHFLASSQQSQQYSQFVGNLYQSVGPAQQRKGPMAASQASSNPQQLFSDSTFYQKWFKFKELIQNLFTFLKNNMIPGLKMPEPLIRFYEGTLRVVLIIRHDFPEFLCDFYFNFVNSLPEHCIQLRNIILSANPRNVPYHNPFSRNLKVDAIPQIYEKPRTLSSELGQEMSLMNLREGQDGAFQDHHVYLTLMNLREDLEKYFRSRVPSIIQVICDKMMQSEEVINGRRKIKSNIINAVALFIGNTTLNPKNPQLTQKDAYDMYKKIIMGLNNETRLCFLNCLVNELRYINSHTYFYSWIVLYLFNDCDEAIQEQITRILVERLQCHEPYPWGICITFRELLQNPKYEFGRKSFVLQHMPLYDQLFQTKLAPFHQTWLTQKNAVLQSTQQQQQVQTQKPMESER